MFPPICWSLTSPVPAGLAAVLPVGQLDGALCPHRQVRRGADGAAAVQTPRPTRPRLRAEAADRLRQPPRPGTAGGDHRLRTYRACRPVKDVGKPCDREGHARIDGGELETGHVVARVTGSGRPRETPGMSAGPTATTHYRASSLPSTARSTAPSCIPSYGASCGSSPTSGRSGLIRTSRSTGSSPGTSARSTPPDE